MIDQPQYITRRIFSAGKNTVRRCYGRDPIALDNDNEANVIKRNPFVVEQDGRKILFTSKINDEAIAVYQYAVLVNKKPTASLYKNGELRSLKWIKHPLVYTRRSGLFMEREIYVS